MKIKKVKKSISKKRLRNKVIIIFAVLGVLGTLLITSVGGQTSTATSYFGDKSVINDTLSEEQNKTLINELGLMAEDANNKNTFDQNNNVIGKMCDYYGTDIRYKMDAAIVESYLKYLEANNKDGSAVTMDIMKTRIEEAINELAPKFTYKVDKIITVREHKELQNQFDISSGCQGANNIKIFATKPSGFNPGNYTSGTNIYINDENKTYITATGAQKSFSTSTLPSNIYVYQNKPNWFNADFYLIGQQIYIISENKTYTAGYADFSMQYGKPSGISNVKIVSSASQLQNAANYNEGDKIYVVSEGTVYTTISNNSNTFNIANGKPSGISNVTIYDTAPSGFDAKKYANGTIIYIINQDKTYKVVQREVTIRTETDQTAYFITEAKNPKGTYDMAYNTVTNSYMDGKDKVTVTKPVLISLKQTDSDYSNLKKTIAARNEDESVNIAADAIVDIYKNIVGDTSSYGDALLQDGNMVQTGGGTFSGQGENFTGTNKEFVDKILPDAIQSYKEYNILPSITLAQASVESAGKDGWGKSLLTVKANNLFGIKAFSGWTGAVVTMLTEEYNASGQPYYTPANFRAYNSWHDSIEDHDKVLMQSNFIAVRTATNYEDAARGLVTGGYATDPAYYDLIVDRIREFNLNQWDNTSK